MNVIIDPEFRDLIPPPTPEELDRLHKSLSAEGFRDPLIVWKGHDILVDGHNRHAYMMANQEDLNERGIAPQFIHMRFNSREEVTQWMILNQLGRRNVDPDTASMLRGKLYNGAKRKDGGHGDQKSEDQNDTPNTAETIAKQTGVSAPTVKRDGKFAKALEELGMTIADFKASGKSKKDITEEAFPPKPKKEKPAPAPAPQLEIEDTRPLSETIVIDDEEDETPAPPKPPEPELEPWTIILMQIPKITKERRNELFNQLATKWDCKLAQ